MNDNKGKVIALSILGVLTLTIAIVGGTFAYLSASASSNNISGEAESGATGITVTKKSNSTGKLIPIDMDTTTLTKAALGYTNTSTNGTADADKACLDKNNYTVCQIYEVVVSNGLSSAMNYNVGVTSLTGTDNVDVVKMASLTSVTDATSIKGSSTGLASNKSISANSTETFYIMVLIKNLSTVQNDSGAFTGTITATSASGGELVADFSSGS